MRTENPTRTLLVILLAAFLIGYLQAKSQTPQSKVELVNDSTQKITVVFFPLDKPGADTIVTYRKVKPELKTAIK